VQQPLAPLFGAKYGDSVWVGAVVT